MEELSFAAVRPAVRSSVDTCFAYGDISVPSQRISMKPGTDIRHVNGHCSKGFQGQRSKVKVECYNGGGVYLDGVFLDAAAPQRPVLLPA